MFQTVHLECHQQRSFTLKMHQNRWRLEFSPRPHWGRLQRSPDPLAGLRGLLLRGGEGKGEEVRGGEGRDFRPSQCWRQIDAPDGLQNVKTRHLDQDVIKMSDGHRNVVIW